MAIEGFNANLVHLKEIEQYVWDLMGDLGGSYLNVWRTKFLDSELKKIWDLATTFQSGVKIHSKVNILGHKVY